MTLEQYLKDQGVNDYSDSETVRRLTRQYEVSNAYPPNPHLWTT